MKQLWSDFKAWWIVFVSGVTSPPKTPEQVSAEEWLEENFPLEDEWEND